MGSEKILSPSKIITDYWQHLSNKEIAELSLETNPMKMLEGSVIRCTHLKNICQKLINYSEKIQQPDEEASLNRIAFIYDKAAMLHLELSHSTYSDMERIEKLGTALSEFDFNKEEANVFLVAFHPQLNIDFFIFAESIFKHLNELSPKLGKNAEIYSVKYIDVGGFSFSRSYRTRESIINAFVVPIAQKLSDQELAQMADHLKKINKYIGSRKPLSKNKADELSHKFGLNLTHLSAFYNLAPNKNGEPVDFNETDNR